MLKDEEDEMDKREKGGGGIRSVGGKGGIGREEKGS